MAPSPTSSWPCSSAIWKSGTSRSGSADSDSSTAVSESWRLLLCPDAGVQALHGTVDDLAEAIAELAIVHDLARGDGFGKAERGTDEAERGFLLVVAGLGAEEPFDAGDDCGNERDAAKQLGEKAHGFSSPVIPSVKSECAR